MSLLGINVKHKGFRQFIFTLLELIETRGQSVQGGHSSIGMVLDFVIASISVEYNATSVSFHHWLLVILTK